MIVSPYNYVLLISFLFIAPFNARNIGAAAQKILTSLIASGIPQNTNFNTTLAAINVENMGYLLELRL